MKLLVNREAFLEALSFASEIVKVRTPKPALTAVLLTVENRRLFVAATDMEVAMRWPVTQVDVTDPGQVLIPCAKLLSVINAMHDDNVSVQSDGEATSFIGVDTRFKLYGYDPKELPVVPAHAPTAADVIIAGGELARMIEQTDYAMAKEPTRYAIAALLFERRGARLNLVSTDGHRIAMTKRDTKDGPDFGWPVSRRMVSLLQKVLAAMPDATVRARIEGGGLACLLHQGENADDAILLRGAMCEGTFPPYDSIIPTDCTRKATINAKRFFGAIRQAELLTCQESKGVRLAFAAGMVRISGRAAQVGEATVDVPCEFEGEPFEIGFNPNYLAQAIKPVNADSVTLEMSTPTKPMLLKMDEGSSAIIMPVHLN